MLQIEDEQHSYKNIVSHQTFSQTSGCVCWSATTSLLCTTASFGQKGKENSFMEYSCHPGFLATIAVKPFKTFTGLKSALRQSSVFLWIKLPSAFCPLPVSPALRLFSSQWCSKLHLPASFPGRCWILEIYRPWGTPLGERGTRWNIS